MTKPLDTRAGRFVRGSLGLLGVLLTSAMLLLSTQVQAHRGHGSWTDFVWSVDRFEITHRIHLADALKLLERIDNEVAIDSMEGMALLAIYVERNFSITAGEGPAALETLGAEIDDDFLYVYQEWLTPLPEAMPVFESTLLHDIEPSAHTYVHVEAPGINETQRLGETSFGLNAADGAPWLQQL